MNPLGNLSGWVLAAGGLYVVFGYDSSVLDIFGVISIGVGSYLVKPRVWRDVPKNLVTPNATRSDIKTDSNSIFRQMTTAFVLFFTAGLIGVLGWDQFLGYTKRYYLLVTIAMVILIGWSIFIMLGLVRKK